MNIAIIPARSGSKRIKSKNIKNFLGKPIISYTIEKLKKTSLFKKIYVSTDCSKIAKISMNYGAEVPFLRSKKLAGDHILTKDVISDFIDNIDIPLNKIKSVFCVYPCTPLLEKEDLFRGLKLFKKNNSSFVYPVLRYKHPIQRSFSINKANKIKYLLPKYELYRTQDLKPFFHDAGQFYISSPKIWKSKKKLHTDCACFEINYLNGIDIDDLNDWKVSEIIYKFKYQ